MTTSASSEPSETVEPLQRAIKALVADARDVRAAATVYEGSAEEAEQRYADEVGTALAMMELDLSIARAALDAQRADSSEELHASVTEAADAARTWLDELRVRSSLARMEVRDRAGVMGRRIDHSSAAVRRAGERVLDAVGGDLDEMRHAALHGIGEVRQALSDTATALRGLGD